MFGHLPVCLLSIYMYMSVIYLPEYLDLYLLSTCLAIYLSVCCLYTCMSVIYLSVYLAVCLLSTCLSIYLSVCCLSTCLSVFYLPVYLLCVCLYYPMILSKVNPLVYETNPSTVVPYNRSNQILCLQDGRQLGQFPSSCMQRVCVKHKMVVSLPMA